MTPETLAQVAETLSRLGVDARESGALRRAFPGIHFSQCHDDDVTRGQPVFAGEGFNLYLVDGRDHCLQLTSDLRRATGLLIAVVGPDNPAA